MILLLIDNPIQEQTIKGIITLRNCLNPKEMEMVVAKLVWTACLSLGVFHRIVRRRVSVMPKSSQLESLMSA